MPMSFPDFESLKRRAEQRKFRQPNEGETEEQFRTAFADFMMNVDRVESSEIRTGRGWNNQSPFELLSNHFGGGEQGTNKLKDLMKSLSAHHYVEEDGADGFSFDWRTDAFEKITIGAMVLEDFAIEQSKQPNNKENFAATHAQLKEIQKIVNKLSSDFDVIEVLLNNGLND